MDLHPPTEVLVVWNVLNKPASDGGSCGSQYPGGGISDDVESDSTCTSPLSSAPNSPIHQLSISDDESIDKGITVNSAENPTARRPNLTKYTEELRVISRESRKSRIRASRSNWFPNELEEDMAKPSSEQGCTVETLVLPPLSHEPTCTNERSRNVITPCKKEIDQESDIPMNSRRTLSNHSYVRRESADDEPSTRSGLEPTTVSLHCVSDDESNSSSHESLTMPPRSIRNQQINHSKEFGRDKDMTSVFQDDAPADELRLRFTKFNNNDRRPPTESLSCTISKSPAPQLPTNITRKQKFIFEEDPTIIENDIEAMIVRNRQEIEQTEQGFIKSERNYQHPLSVSSELSPQPQQLDPSLDEELRNISGIVSDDEFGTEDEHRQPSSYSWHKRSDNGTNAARTGRNNNYIKESDDWDIAEPPAIHTRFRNNNHTYDINNSHQSISSNEIPDMSLDLTETSSYLNSSKMRFFNILPSNDVGPEDELKANTLNSSIDQHLQNFLLNESDFNNQSTDALLSKKYWTKNNTMNNSLDSDPTITFILNESELNLSSTSRNSYNENCSGSIGVPTSRLAGGTIDLKMESTTKVDTDSRHQVSEISDTKFLDVYRNNQFSLGSCLGNETLEQRDVVTSFSEVERNSDSDLMSRNTNPCQQPCESRFNDLDHEFSKQNQSVCGGKSFNTTNDSQVRDSSQPHNAFTVKSMFDVISGFGNMLLGYESVGDETRDEIHSIPSRNQVFEPVGRPLTLALPPTNQTMDGNNIDGNGSGSTQQSNSTREPLTPVQSLLDKSLAEEASKELAVVPDIELAGRPFDSIVRTENLDSVLSNGVTKQDIKGTGIAFSISKNERTLGARHEVSCGVKSDSSSARIFEPTVGHSRQVFDDVGEPPALRRVRTSLEPDGPIDHSRRLETSSSCSSQGTTDLAQIRYAQIDVSGEMITEVYEVVQSISPWSDFVTSRDNGKSETTKNILSNSSVHKSNAPVAKKSPTTEVKSHSLLGELDEMVKDLDKTLDEDSPERTRDNADNFRGNAISKLDNEKTDQHTDDNKLNNKKAAERATPLLVISIDNDIGIPKGDIMISLLNNDESTDNRLQKNIWPRKVSEAIWRCRKMRRNCDTKWLTTSAERNSPRHGQRTSVIVDVDDVRVLGGVDSIADTQAAVIEHLKCDDFDDAIVMYASILDIYNNFAIENDCTEQSVFQHKKYVATALHNIGVIHMLSGSYQEAFTFFERATMIRASSLGVHHPDHITSLVKMAMCLFSLGDFPNAHSSLEMAANLGKDDLENLADLFQFSEILNNIACLSFMCGEIGTAVELFQQCLELLSAISDNATYIGSKYSCHSVSLNISICKANLAILALGGGDVDSCIKGLESAMKDQILLLRDADPTLITTIKHLVAANVAAGRKNKALQVDAFGPDSSKCKDTCKKIVELENTESLQGDKANLYCRPKNDQSSNKRTKPSRAMFNSLHRESDEI